MSAAVLFGRDAKSPLSYEVSVTDTMQNGLEVCLTNALCKVRKLTRCETGSTDWSRELPLEGWRFDGSQRPEARPYRNTETNL